MSRSIAVVDDDLEMLALLDQVLTRAGYKVRTYGTPGKFFDGLLKAKPDLCLVDVQLPGMDGREVVRVMRSNPETRDVAVIAISATAIASPDIVRGMDSGADEYLTKPLDLDLLLARIANLIARGRGGAPARAPEVVRWESLEVYPEEHRALLAGKEVPLTHLEFKLLSAFLGQPQRVLARSWLLQTVWESAPDVATRTVDKHVEALRRKIPVLAGRLETVVGVGYMFRA